MVDLLIVGSGITGATIADLASRDGFSVLVLEQRSHVGGNCYTECKDDILIHSYGSHIFHTNNKVVWDYVNGHIQFDPYVHQVKAKRGDRIYSLPFTLNTFYEVWGTTTIAAARQKLESERYIGPIHNLEQQAKALVGETLYHLLIKDYTEKQWGRPCSEMPAEIIKRIPLRFEFSSNYFPDRYVGIPRLGYTPLIESMLSDSVVLTDIDFNSERNYWKKQARLVIYTGCIDAYYNYGLGQLQYRTLDFEHSRLDVPNHQGIAVLNDTSSTNSWTRTIEHKYFHPNACDHTLITKETPREWQPGDIPYYPIPTEPNRSLYGRYRLLADQETNVLFAGRLGSYRYLDMHVAIENAMHLYDTSVIHRLS